MNQTRRSFLKQSWGASFCSTSVLSSILNLRITGSLAAEETPEPGYKALVCVFLAGGNDCFNMLTPIEGESWASYQLSRGQIALPLDAFTSLPAPLDDGRQLGLNKAMPEIAGLFNNQRLSFVANIGTLVGPTTKQEVENNSAKLPLGLFSHSDQQKHWQSSLPETRNPLKGWGGRMSQILGDLNGSSKVSMNISTAGVNVFQSGSAVTPFTITPGDLPTIRAWDEPFFAPRQQAMEAMLDAEYRNIFERAYSSSKKEAIEAGLEYKSAIENPDLGDSPAFSPDNELSVQLEEVYKAIASRETLNKSRQTFFVQIGGWDSHGSLVGHPTRLANLSKALGEFQNAIDALGIADDVTTFTSSEFGRTLSSNDGGSDHAWGGIQFVMSGAANLNGGKVFGDYPDLALGSSLDLGRGRLIPTISVDEYFADLALWMGVSPSSLPTVLPNLSRFHDVSGGDAPLGLFAS